MIGPDRLNWAAMRRLFVTALLGLVCVGGLGTARPASAQELTAVQKAFVNPRPLTMVPEITAPDPEPAFNLQFDFDQQAPPADGSTAQTAPAEFKKAKLSKVILYGLELTFYEHVMRVAAQNFTRQELKGPFLKDWIDSVHMPHQWGDGDSWQVNYLGHAIHGSAAARIWLDQREPKPTSKKQYFKSLSHAFLFSVIFSEQYEIGPLSEASIGNVGLRAGRTGWTDQVWTPCGAILWAMAEDGIDKYAITWIDKHVPFLMARAAARMVFNPGRMLANVSQNRTPWFRADRPIGAGLGR
jgi:hypothetical protein